MREYFTWVRGGLPNIQLDIVGFLCVLGEGSVLANYQVASLSWISCLPRFLPAPQALIKPSRPDKLSSYSGHATSVHSGNLRHHINHVGHMLVDAEHYPDYSVRVVRIERRADHLGNGSGTAVEDSLTALAFGPLTWAALTGCSFSIIILALAIKKRDGMALLADIFLSFLSSLVGIACKWTLKLPKRLNRNDCDPPGDVVIRYLKGSFLVVQCDEDVARELYFAPENIEYLVKQPWRYRIISLAGTMLLMFGVIFLGNATTLLQTYIAGAYIILNAIYWVVAALPNKVHWDTSCFVVTDQYIENPNEIIEKSFTSDNKSQCVDFNRTFTEALWKAILVTKDVDWVKRSAAAPDTAAWREWLYQAKQESGKASNHSVLVDGREVKVWKNPGWNAHQALKTCMENNKSDPEKADDVALRASLAQAQDTTCDADDRQTEY